MESIQTHIPIEQTILDSIYVLLNIKDLKKPTFFFLYIICVLILELSMASKKRLFGGNRASVVEPNPVVNTVIDSLLNLDVLSYKGFVKYMSSCEDIACSVVLELVNERGVLVCKM